MTPAPPISPTSSLDKYINVFIAVGVALGVFLIITVVILVMLVCVRGNKESQNKKKDDEGRIPLHPIRKVNQQ